MNETGRRWNDSNQSLTRMERQCIQSTIDTVHKQYENIKKISRRIWES